MPSFSNNAFLLYTRELSAKYLSLQSVFYEFFNNSHPLVQVLKFFGFHGMVDDIVTN
jgi:hypothetical protein